MTTVELSTHEFLHVFNCLFVDSLSKVKNMSNSQKNGYDSVFIFS